MTTSDRAGSALKGAALMLALLASSAATHAATVIINNRNAAGVGFNDTTPADPAGGNPGTTLGEQRLFAFTYAANIWGANLDSSQPIIIDAQMTPLTCTATSATLGSAGATSTFRNFANAPFTDTWYAYALANKLAGAYQGTANAAQITANFNSDLGVKAGCLPGRKWYLGVDGQHGDQIDFVVVLLHEMGHGLGFQTFTVGATGTQSSGFPSIWDRFLTDNSTGKLWKDMTNAERKASAISRDKLAWAGPNVTAAIPSVLAFGLASATFSGPAAGDAAGMVRVGEADAGPPLGASPIYGEVMPVVEQTAGAGEACEPLNAVNARAVAGKVALVTLGGSTNCTNTLRVKNVQNAGAIAMILADNAADAGVQPIPLGGLDGKAGITITSVRMFMTDAAKLRTALLQRSRTKSGVFVSLGRNAGAQYAGADAQGRALLFAPNPYVSGSSVSHFDRSAFRNQLMEPNISYDLTQSVNPPEDLTLKLFKDIGW